MIWIHCTVAFSSKYGDRKIRRSRMSLTAGIWAVQVIIGKYAHKILIGQDLTAEER